MNYTQIYEQLIIRAKTRIPPEGYIEHHHIIPRCLGGSDDKENIAILTPEEHFVAHVLLVKIHPEVPGLIVAVSRMCKGKGRKRRRLYGWLRRKHSSYLKEIQSGKGNSQYGTIWIHRGLENKKIKKNETIPEGWGKGRQQVIKQSTNCILCNKDIDNSGKKYCTECKTRKLENNILLLNDMYKFYKKHGWELFVETYHYPYSQQNLVMLFKNHLENFSPQQGKKRGKGIVA